jgi:hypothetical protein
MEVTSRYVLHRLPPILDRMETHFGDITKAQLHTAKDAFAVPGEPGSYQRNMADLTNACGMLSKEDIQGFVRYFGVLHGVTVEQATLAERAQDLGLLVVSADRGRAFVSAATHAYEPLPLNPTTIFVLTLVYTPARPSALPPVRAVWVTVRAAWVTAPTPHGPYRAQWHLHYPLIDKPLNGQEKRNTKKNTTSVNTVGHRDSHHESVDEAKEKLILDLPVPTLN